MLSTHILDISRGCPAAEVDVALYRVTSAARTFVARAKTDKDGRIASPFGGALDPGVYELSFQIADYFAESFYDEIPVRFRITDSAARYHVPLLVSPYGYSTYRGS